MMGRRADEAFFEMKTYCQMPETIEELKAESNEIFHKLLHEKIKPMPGLFDLLDLIEQRDLPKAVATSSGRSYLEEVLGRFELLHRFQTTLTSEDVTHGKPHPEIYLQAARRLQVAPAQMLVLEDSSNGTKAAAAAGAHIVTVPHIFSRNQDFTGTRHIATSLLDNYILQLLQHEITA